VDFSCQQETALELVEYWLQSDRQVFRLFGYAGTGKTTLARYLKADFYAAYTGKAAHVLIQKGCPATTIHSLIYQPKDKSTARLQWLLEQIPKTPEAEKLAALYREISRERENVKKPSFTLNLDSPLRGARLLVIDECSMVDEQIGRDLESFGCRILVLGDPAQLPPVFGGGYFTAVTPDMLLTEVHRQARDNPVLDLATTVRETGRLPAQHPLMLASLSPQDALGVDQIIVGRNRTRHAINRRMRELLDFTEDFPMIGEKVVCTRNNHQLGILNGATYEVTGTSHGWLELDGQLEVEVHPEPFVGVEVDHWKLRDAEMFEYGYALTCHKAQGSQWDRVGVIDQSADFAPNNARWLYTAITRAAKGLWVTKGN